MTETQIAWINQVKKGNELAAFNLYNSYSKAMYNTLTRLTNDQEIAKDLLQESFVKAFKRIEDLEDPKAFAGWLKRIVINTGLEFVRKKKYEFEDIDELNTIETEEVDELRIDSNSIHNAIQSLPDGCRTVLSL
ncbi:MAG: RNA polymerase sigma factor, partial [Bacteroidota bacterium]